MESSISAIPVEQQQLAQFRERANRLLTAVRWTPVKGADGSKASGEELAWRESAFADQQARECSVMKGARAASGDALLLAEEINRALTAVRQGLQIGMHLSKIYSSASGLEQLIALNNRGGMTDIQKTEFRAKYTTAAAVAVFCAAAYPAWELSRAAAEDLQGVQLDFRGIPEVSLRDPVRALDCLVFYYAMHLEEPGLVRTPLDFAKLTQLYFKAALDEIILREGSLQYADAFTAQSYKLQGSEFSITGFKDPAAGATGSVEFNRVELGDIVGNRDAKHHVRRLAGRLLCYDPERKRNPMADLGGLPFISLGYGEPGTGKSMLIAALATMLNDYCKDLGRSFLFWPLPDTVVSTFQGGSAERMMTWMRAVKDPAKIIYAPIDDAENNLEDRTRQGVSAGVREVIAVFLRNTEGAYAVNHGNAVIQLFTNIPDQIDKAVMSRINDRMYIGGATKVCDFLDQDYLWWRKHRELDRDFVKMRDPQDYEYLSQQALLGSLSEVYDSAVSPKQPQVQEVFAQMQKRRGSEEQLFFAELFEAVKQRFPLFTSRDVRNMQRAVDSRIMDFDLPQEWFDDPGVFFAKGYDEKKAMIVELMKANMRGLSFAEIRLQEAVRYLDNMAVIAETGKERRIAQLTEEWELRQEAERRLHAKRGDE